MQTKDTSEVRKIVPGKYSGKKAAHDELRKKDKHKDHRIDDRKRFQCYKCFSKTCTGGKSVQHTTRNVSAVVEWVILKAPKRVITAKKKNTSRVQDQEHTSSAEYATDSDLTDSDPEESSSDSEPQVNCTQGRRSKNHIAVRRIGTVRKASNGRTVYKVSSKKYHVEVIVNEKEVPAFADTGVDISVISHKVAKQLGLTL